MPHRKPKLNSRNRFWRESQPQTACKPQKWKRQRGQPKRVLRFSPYAWAKLLFLRDLGPTEVGGFGITRADDLLFVEDIRLVQQVCTSVTVHFHDDAVADFFDEQIDLGRRPEQFARTWIHTHPADSAHPSGVDEETFDRVFGNCDWAVMAILARGGETYARLRFNVGPAGTLRIPVEVDFGESFPAADPDGWAREYEHHVKSGESEVVWEEELPWVEKDDEFELLATSVDENVTPDVEEQFL